MCEIYLCSFFFFSNSESFLTAKEWQNWLLYLAIPVLSGILPDIYMRSLEKLVRALRILLQREFTVAEVQQAKVQLYITTMMCLLC